MEATIYHDHEENRKAIFSGIQSKIKNGLYQDGLNYYTNMTKDQIEKRLINYKTGFLDYKNRLSNTDSIQEYFNAYQYILQFRKFILGNLGEINYTFVIRTNTKDFVNIQTLTLGSASFIDLIKNQSGVITGLKKDGDNIRISGIIPKLRELIASIQGQGMQIKISQNCNSFVLTNDRLGTRQEFSNGKLFKSYIQTLQRHQNAGKWYDFELKINKDNSTESETKVFSIEILNVHNSPKSSSIFSAIGKYFTDETIAKKNIANLANISIDSNMPNAGNLTELYILAKARLNNGQNNFYHPRRQPVKGQDLFALYKQVKSNTNPFYSGGDFLMNQIKSFLGSNPSLTSYKTIRKSIENFYNALNSTNTQTIKESLSKLLLQKSSTQNTITEIQKDLSNDIANAFEQFFSKLQ